MMYPSESILSWSTVMLCMIAGVPRSAIADGPAVVPETAAVVHPELWPGLDPALPPDPATALRIDDLLRRMTLAEKVGQLIQADITAIEPSDIARYPLGAILNGGDQGPGRDDRAPPATWLALADAFHDAARARGGAHIPLLWGVDAVHGHNNIIGATIFPHNIGLGAAHDAELVRRIGAATAVEVSTTGQDWTFAPALAVARDLRWGRTYESYSDDPDLVRLYAAAMVEGLQGGPGSPTFLRDGHILATAKHFLGDGGTTSGQDQGDNRAPEAELRDIDGAGYVGALQAGVQTVMASFSSWQGRKMHGNRDLLTTVLKDRWGFDGFVIGDWNAHAQLPGCSATSCAAAIDAGVDMLMAPDSWKPLFQNLLADAESGRIPADRLNDAVRRILRVKARAGLFDGVKPSERPYAGHFELLGSIEHRVLARQAVRESLVLLKNNGQLLPLRPGLRVLVAGDGADDIGKQCGGWTISWQGHGNVNADFPHGESIFSGIRRAAEAGGGTATLSVDGSFAARPDVAIMIFGEDPYAEGNGDRTTLAFEGDRALALLQRMRESKIPVVAVFLSGRPLWTTPEINAADAFVAAWLPGTEGGGIADLLFRHRDGSIGADFRGRLSFPWPRRPFAGAAKPLFARGYGLTYANPEDLRDLAED